VSGRSGRQGQLDTRLSSGDCNREAGAKRPAAEIRQDYAQLSTRREQSVAEPPPADIFAEIPGFAQELPEKCPDLQRSFSHRPGEAA